MSNTPTAPSSVDRFAGLRKAQEALSAIDKGDGPPGASRPATSANGAAKSTPRLFKARAPLAAAETPPDMAGAVVSKPYDPSAAPAEAARFSPRLVPSKDQSLGFDALKLAHQKVGRDVSRQDGDVVAAAPTSPAVAVNKQFLDATLTEAKIGRLHKLVDQTALYYRADPVETQKEKAFLATLSGADLDSMMAAYEVAAHHVLIMTSDSHAREEALERNKQLQAFYKNHGTSEDQIENDRSQQMAPPTKAKPKR